MYFGKYTLYNWAMGKQDVLGQNSPLINFEVQETLKEKDCDPIAFLAEVVNGTHPDASMTDRIRAATELSSYVHAKKKAFDVRLQSKNTTTFQVVKFADVMPEKAEQLVEMTRKMVESQMSVSNREARLEFRNVVNHSAVVTEAMRRDVETLEVDENGMPAYDQN
jgi:hypothetical protein